MGSVKNERNSVELDSDELLNPYSRNLSVGRKEGEALGLQRGFDEGYVLGCKKSWEYKFELGYYIGFVNDIAVALDLPAFQVQRSSIENSNRTSGATSNPTDKANRIARNISALLEEIKSFPSDDDLFRENVNSSDNFSDEKPDGKADFDIVVSMQGIRAKVSIIEECATC